MSLKTTQRKVINEVGKRANTKARGEFLYDPRIVSAFSPKTIRLARDSKWGPFEIRYEWSGGFGLAVKLLDPIVKKIRLDDELNDKLERIVSETFAEVVANSD